MNFEQAQKEYALLVKQKPNSQRLIKFFRKHYRKITLKDIDPDGRILSRNVSLGQKAVIKILSKQPFKIQLVLDGGTEWVWFRRDLFPFFIEQPIPRSVIKSALSDASMKHLYKEFSKTVRTNPEIKAFTSSLTIGTNEAEHVLEDVIRDLHTSMVQAVIKTVQDSFTPQQKVEILCHNQSYHNVDWKQVFENYTFLKEQTQSVRREILDRIPENPIDLYPAARRLKRHFILHVGPTNSGKTHDSLVAFRNAKSGVYLAPLRLMANEIYDQTNKMGVLCSMETGEEHILIPGATHTACTVELMDPERYVEVAVIDEAQMLEDASRGGNWTAAILGVPALTIHVCMAPYAEEMVIRLIESCGDSHETIRHERQAPLRPDRYEFSFPKSVRPGDALIVFSKKSVLHVAAELRTIGVSCSVIYGALPYDVRANEVDRFARGETDVVVATDAIGMGLNLPIRRIVFLEMTKFDGTERRELKPTEIQQIAGRAGRYGKFEVGYYTAEFNKEELIETYRTYVPPLAYVYLRFPKTLLSIQSPVSVLLTEWMGMENDGLYYKSDMKQEIALAEELEDMSSDKEMIYDFCMIPFDQDDEKLHDIWLELFAIAQSGDDTYDILKYLSYKHYASMDLDDLEEEHKIIGLLLYYSWKYSIPEYSEELMKLKKEVCTLMIQLLSEQTYEERTCPSCGKKLPWNWPYRICDDCYKNRDMPGRRRRKVRW